MFGSLRLPKGKLTEAEQRLYNGHFCALCHGLDQWGGKIASLLTNYDTTFWLLVLAALDEDRHGPAPLNKLRCTAVPFRQVGIVQLRPQTRQLAAALTLALVGAKVEDDRLDGDRPWVQWAFLPLRSSWARAGPWLDQVGFPRDAIEGLGPWQRAMEVEATSLQELAQPTQAMLEAVFGFVADYTEQPSCLPALHELGRSLGLWIYLFDAYSDQGRDARSGAFNALARFPQPPGQLASQMLHALNHAQRALARLPLGSRRPMLELQVARLRQLTREQFGVVEPSSGGAACWVMGGLAAAALTPTAAVACDGCDCGGCDGCDCGGCEGCNCEACNCEACNCEALECCNACDCCQGCEGCQCNSSKYDWICCCHSDSTPPKSKTAPPPKEDELPGTTRVKRKWPWSKKKPKPVEDPPQPG
ncbi:hypothetical protein IV102_30750 [bacterium]|nr:hypothetical protein [bacterium]